ncbi:MAG: type II secretion system F family protein [Bdellovibrionales bacterium]
MAKFFYQAKHASGALKSGVVDAANEQDARLRLKSQRLDVVRIVQTGGDKKAAGGLGALFKGSASVSPKELQIFTRQMSTLINAGIPIVDALRILIDGSKIGGFKEALSQIKSDLETGKRLSTSLAQHPKIFDRLYCNLVEAGEEAGILDQILTRLAVYIEKNQKIKSQVKGALVLPIGIIGFAILVISGILWFVVPKLQEVFSASGKELPALTQWVINLSNELKKNWMYYIASAIGGPWALIQYVKTDEGKKIFDGLIIQMPLFGDLILRSSVARMTRTLSTLLSSGVGLIESIEIAARTSGNYSVEEALLRTKEQVLQGRPLAAPMSKEKLIPEMVTQMVAIGEQSGSVDQMLGKIADFYEDEVENAVKALTAMIEPLLMVVLGVAIAVLVVAMYLPVFSLGDTISG